MNIVVLWTHPIKNRSFSGKTGGRDIDHVKEVKHTGRWYKSEKQKAANGGERLLITSYEELPTFESVRLADNTMYILYLHK